MPKTKFTRKTTAEILADMSLPATRGASKSQLDAKTTAVLQHYDPAFTALASLPAEASPYPVMPKPKRGDWLDEQEEPGRPFRSFLRGQFKAQPHANFNEIALVIIGDGFPADVLVLLKEYVAAFYQLKVSIHGPVKVEEADPPIRTCINSYTRKRQLFAADAMNFAQSYLRKDRARSRNVTAFMGITMEDLTKNEEWNFLYGLASLVDGCGVFSMARFSPAFNGEVVSGPEEEAAIILRRCCKVVTHELGHIFGLKHCIHFGCLMNGANHVDELNRQQLLECPVCTKKLQSSFWWNLPQRYASLGAMMERLGFVEEASKVAELIIPTIENATKGTTCAEHGTRYAAVKPSGS